MRASRDGFQDLRRRADFAGMGGRRDTLFQAEFPDWRAVRWACGHHL